MKTFFLYVLKKGSEVIPTLFLVTVVVFSLAHMGGGDPIVTMLGTDATPEMVEAVRKQYALDRPLHEQYFLWLGNLFQGDFGTSIRTRQEVAEMIMERMHITITLAIACTIASILAGIVFGCLSAARQNSPLDYGVMVVAIMGMSFPSYFIALVLIVIFAVLLKWLPIAGFTINVLESPMIALRNLIMPTIALSADYSALIARLTRSSLLEVLGEDYIRTARAKGQKEKKVVYSHALRNAIIPVITIASINFVYRLGGTIILEEIFALPGLGRLLIEAVNNRDFPVIQGITLMIGFFFIVVSFFTDMVYTLVDPRIRT